MAEVFHYPMPYPALWLDYYYYVTWFLSMLLLALGWGLFFRFGRFTYAINLGCFWKTGMMLVLFVVTLGGPMYYNTRFSAEHGEDGASVKIDGSNLSYLDRTGAEKSFLLTEITAVRQERITYNPPAKIFIVASRNSLIDSVFVTRKLEGFDRFIELLSERTGLRAKMQPNE